MAQVNLVNKQVQMNLAEIIKFQLITHCYIHLGVLGEAELTEFCNLMAKKRIDDKLKTWKPSTDNPKERRPEASPQTIRNVLIKVEKEKLLFKEGKGRKKITLSPELNIQTTGNILLNYKLVHLGSKEA